MSIQQHYVAFSGGKDSTAMVLRMAELGECFECLFTPTGNELPDLIDHIHTVLAMASNPALHLSKGPSLENLINDYNALPNWRQRWCTRKIKIEPCIAFLQARPGSVLCVGLRADEEERLGLYGEYATYRYPLREWRWGLEDVWSYLKSRGVSVPERTDCAVCYGQRLAEWYRLWRRWPAEYLKGEAWEEMTGHTFRSGGRDSWPSALKDLRLLFESGAVPRGAMKQIDIFAEDCEKFDPDTVPCRVCRL